MDNETKNTPEKDSESSSQELAVDWLSESAVAANQKTCKKTAGIVQELLMQQSVLSETIQKENSEFETQSAIDNFSKLMDRAKEYNLKLIELNKEINVLTEKANRLKKRSVKLQQYKENVLAQKVFQKRKYLEHESNFLVAKTADYTSLS